MNSQERDNHKSKGAHHLRKSKAKEEDHSRTRSTYMPKEDPLKLPSQLPGKDHTQKKSFSFESLCITGDTMTKKQYLEGFNLLKNLGQNKIEIENFDDRSKRFFYAIKFSEGKRLSYDEYSHGFDFLLSQVNPNIPFKASKMFLKKSDFDKIILKDFCDWPEFHGFGLVQLPNLLQMQFKFCWSIMDLDLEARNNFENKKRNHNEYRCAPHSMKEVWYNLFTNDELEKLAQSLVINNPVPPKTFEEWEEKEYAKVMFEFMKSHYGHHWGNVLHTMKSLWNVEVAYTNMSELTNICPNVYSLLNKNSKKWSEILSYILQINDIVVKYSRRRCLKNQIIAFQNMIKILKKIQILDIKKEDLEESLKEDYWNLIEPVLKEKLNKNTLSFINDHYHKFFRNEDFLSGILETILHCEQHNVNKYQTASHILIEFFQQLHEEELKIQFTHLVLEEEGVDSSFCFTDSNMTFTLGTSNPYMVHMV